MKMKKLSLLLATVAAAAMSGTANAASYIYAGSWSVGDGPEWPTNPRVYTGQEAAALLFGGAAADYAISTIDNNIANINFRAHVDGWGNIQYLYGASSAAQNFSLDTGGSGYDSAPGVGSAYSAYVRDHSNAGDPSTRNYAFRIVNAGVPEPAAWAMMIAGFGLVGGAMRKRTKVSVSYA